MLIIEGHEASGKSTLARHIATKLGVNIQESLGPPRYPGEIYNRILTYEHLDTLGYIFVRHPIVSQCIYGDIRGPDPANAIPYSQQHEFYKRDHLFIYCDPLPRSMKHHVRSTHDTDDHLAAVEANYCKILSAYRNWGLKHAHIIYRIGDSMDRCAAFSHHYVTSRHVGSSRLPTPGNRRHPEYPTQQR